MSDSESSDSDCGIRFKTTSTRHRDGGNFSLSYMTLQNGKESRENSKSSKDYRTDSKELNNRHNSPYRNRYTSTRTHERKRSRDRSKSSNNGSGYKERENRNRRSPSQSSIDRKSENQINRNKRGSSGDSFRSKHKEKKRSPRREADNRMASSTLDKITIEVKNINNVDIDKKSALFDNEKRRKILEEANEEKKLFINNADKDVIEIISDEDNVDENKLHIETNIEQIFGPALPPPKLVPGTIEQSCKVQDFKDTQSISIAKHLEETHSSSEEICGPALPPHLLKRTDEKTENTEKKIVGPTLPSHLQLQSEDVSSESLEEDNELLDELEDACIGPLPIGANMTTAQLELEKRALEMKLAKLDAGESSKLKVKTREEWMLELPQVNSLRSLGRPTARQFHTKERPDFSDRSSWTDTPEEKEKKKLQGPTEVPVLTIQEQAQKRLNTKRDSEQEKLAKKHKKKHKRDESLLDIHKKKLKKLKKQEDKTEKETRRPFSRDVDLQVNRFDQAQKNAIIRKAQLLDTRFSSGETKYL